MLSDLVYLYIERQRTDGRDEYQHAIVRCSMIERERKQLIVDMQLESLIDMIFIGSLDASSRICSEENSENKTGRSQTELNGKDQTH